MRFEGIILPGNASFVSGSRTTMIALLVSRELLKSPRRSAALGVVRVRMGWGRASRSCSLEKKKNARRLSRCVSPGMSSGPPMLTPAVV